MLNSVDSGNKSQNREDGGYKCFKASQDYKNKHFKKLKKKVVEIGNKKNSLTDRKTIK